MNREKRIEILKILQSVMPKVTTELEHKTPFELLIAVVLSAQATDKSVNVATRQIFPEANTPEGILKFGEDRFRDCIKHVGLYKGKTKNVMKLCEILRDEYDSQVPEDIEKLQKLPGVGKKTASVVMNVAFNAPFIGVDTHVFRVANRTGYAKGKTPLEVQKKMEKYTPAEYKPKAHQWFLRIGRYICKARIPECWRCPIEQLCEYKEKVLVKPEPKKSKKAQQEENQAPQNTEKEELYLGPTGSEPELLDESEDLLNESVPESTVNGSESQKASDNPGPAQESEEVKSAPKDGSSSQVEDSNKEDTESKSIRADSVSQQEPKIAEPQPAIGNSTSEDSKGSTSVESKSVDSNVAPKQESDATKTEPQNDNTESKPIEADGVLQQEPKEAEPQHASDNSTAEDSKATSVEPK